MAKGLEDKNASIKEELSEAVSSSVQHGDPLIYYRNFVFTTNGALLPQMKLEVYEENLRELLFTEERPRSCTSEHI
ncbi:hypothetical protein GJAV_G00087990 [Gymnothorax javanicus]|nr:hypothetical protein GJAV_G00087990 [Gymnothorax javanicus]